jgi:hypothetical protein
MPIIAVLGIASLVQILRGTREAPALRARVLVAYFMWGTALTFEVFEKVVIGLETTWRGFPLQRYTKLIEESCELIAPAVLLACVVELLARKRESTALRTLEPVGNEADMAA